MSIRDHTLAVAKAHSAILRLSIPTLSAQIYGDSSRLPMNRKTLSVRIGRLLPTAPHPDLMLLHADRLRQVRDLLCQLALHKAPIPAVLHGTHASARSAARDLTQ